METMCAPSYANIFIDHFERKYINPLIEGKSLTYFRYIDDISLIWTGTKNELDQFFKDLNKNHLSIKFDYKALKGRIVFLSRQWNISRNLANKFKSSRFIQQPQRNEKQLREKRVLSTINQWTSWMDQFT